MHFYWKDYIVFVTHSHNICSIKCFCHFNLFTVTLLLRKYRGSIDYVMGQYLLFYRGPIKVIRRYSEMLIQRHLVLTQSNLLMMEKLCSSRILIGQMWLDDLRKIENFRLWTFFGIGKFWKWMILAQMDEFCTKHEEVVSRVGLLNCHIFHEINFIFSGPR